jgi:CRP-like cAMP-binding protein
MPIYIRFARSSTERDAVFRLRALLTLEGTGTPLERVGQVPPLERVGQVPSLEELMDGRRLVPRRLDRFDAYPTTMSFLALDGGVPVGTMRAVVHTPAGLPSASIRPHGAEDRPVLLDALHLRAPYQGSSAVMFGLLKVAVRWARRANATRVSIPAPPFIQPVLQRIGFLEEIDQLYSASINALRPSFLEPFDDPYQDRLVAGCDRGIYRRGEYLFRRGGVADRVYVVARGRVKLIGRDRDGLAHTVAELGPGALLGEEIGGGEPARRWVDAVADARETDVWTRPAESFLSQVDADPELRRAFHRAMATRIQALTSPLWHRQDGVLRGLIDILLDLSARLSPHLEQPGAHLACCSTRWLAEQLGCGETRIDEVLDVLAARELVDVRRGMVTVLDPAGLAEAHPEPRRIEAADEASRASERGLEERPDLPADEGLVVLSA